MKLQNKYLGSKIAIILGIFMIVASLGIASQGQMIGTELEGGIVAITGANAYRSIKRRKLGLLKRSTKSIFVEGLGLFVAVLFFVLGITVAQKAAFESPAGLVVAPIWSVAAYLTIYFHDPKTNNDQGSFFRRKKSVIIAVSLSFVAFIIQNFLSLKIYRMFN